MGTAAGPIRLVVEADGNVRVDMGSPVFDPAGIPFEADTESDLYRIDAGGTPVDIAALSMGNPHAVLVVDDVASAPVETLGPALENHPRFPRRTNVGFMSIVDRDLIDLRVYERGAGETLACGTGACAAVVAGNRLGLLDGRVRVRLPGGELVVSWQGNESPVWMSGPAARVFDGIIRI